MLKAYLGRCTGSRKPGSTHCSIVEALAVSNDIRNQHQLSLSKALHVTVQWSETCKTSCSKHSEWHLKTLGSPVPEIVVLSILAVTQIYP